MHERASFPVQVSVNDMQPSKHLYIGSSEAVFEPKLSIAGAKERRVNHITKRRSERNPRIVKRPRIKNH